MNAQQKIISAIGAPRLMQLLGVKKSSMYEVPRRGFFPASWYRVLKRECESHGIELSMDDFKFKGQKEDA